MQTGQHGDGEKGKMEGEADGVFDESRGAVVVGEGRRKQILLTY